MRILKLWEGGLVFYGGFLGALLAGFVYCRLQKLNYWEIGDLLMPSVMLGLVFGRIGCTLAGCCFGKACGPHFALGITFNNPLGLGIKHTPLYPTQVISAINAFVIFLILWLYRKRKTFHGELVAICLIVYGITRSLIEVLREDPRGFVQLGPVLLSESQLVSLFMLLLASYVLIWVRPKQSLSPQPQTV